MTYTGTQPFDGLTPRQSACIDTAARHAPDASWRDGIRRNVRAQLVGDGPWSDPEVAAAIKTTLANLGVASVFDLEGE
jgi:hypothetical protein